MEKLIESVLNQFESGRISRRQMVAQLAAAAGAASVLSAPTAVAAAESPTFRAVNYNHLALRVTDIARSREFYVKHLGMSVARESANDCFLTFGNSFLALFKGDRGELHHYCYGIENYNVAEAEKTLRAEGLEPDQPRGTNRIYFKDPDGITVQLSGVDHAPR